MWCGVLCGLFQELERENQHLRRLLAAQQGGNEAMGEVRTIFHHCHIILTLSLLSVCSLLNMCVVVNGLAGASSIASDPLARSVRKRCV